MSSAAYCVGVFSVLCAWAQAAPPGTEAARSQHFEVYSQGPAGSARSILLEFERLHAFFQQQTGLLLDNRSPVRVIAFGAPDEYRPYQLSPTADAYYVGAASRDYIVMVTTAPGDFRVPAHEYMHLLLHDNGIDLPPWLNEGLSEVVATVSGSKSRHRPDGGLPAARYLRTRAWMPVSELVGLRADSPLRKSRDTSDLFYAESWALADMLTAAPKYSPRFPSLFAELSRGRSSAEALTTIYGQSLGEITTDLQAWVRHRRVIPIILPPPSPDVVDGRTYGVSPFAWRSVLADLLLVTGKLGQAEEAYHALAAEAPRDPEISAALAMIFLQKNDRNSARAEWRHALEEGLEDPDVCYQFAVEANQAGWAAEEVRPALERAVAARPDFDDALYLLALMDNNAGLYQAAVAHLRSMKKVAPARSFVYWATLANSLNELNQPEEAAAAAVKAATYAATAEEHAHAAQLEYIARTDVAVEITHDADGKQRLVTTRIPHGAADWNPFVEPSDIIRRAEGALRSIDCTGAQAHLVVAAGGKLLTIVIADPQRVQMRGAPQEFTCGVQPPNRVTVVYAASSGSDGAIDGIARGIEFH